MHFLSVQDQIAAEVTRWQNNTPHIEPHKKMIAFAKTLDPQTATVEDMESMWRMVWSREYEGGWTISDCDACNARGVFDLMHVCSVEGGYVDVALCIPCARKFASLIPEPAQ